MKNPLKILSVNQIDEVRGGSDRCFFNTNELLTEEGVDVIPFFSSKTNFEYPIEIDFDEKSIKNIVSYFYNYDAKIKLKNLLISNDDINLAHLHIYYGKLTSSILAPLKEKGIPIVQTLHEYKLSCPVYTHISNGSVCNKCVRGSSFNSIFNKCKDGSLIASSVRFLEFNLSRFFGDVDKVDRFICVSNFQKEKMIEAGVPETKLRVIYNFVDCDRITKNVLNGDYLLYFGRLERLKGIHTLISAMQNHKEKTLFIVGEGAYENELKVLVEQLGLSDSVKFLGFKSGDELWGLVRNCKCVMVPSEWYENCSMTVLEAKAFCKPVIGASIGGITEQIQDGVNGYLHEPCNTESLSDAIERLYSAQDYNSLALASRNDLDSRYSKSMYFNKLMALYEELL